MMMKTNNFDGIRIYVSSLVFLGDEIFEYIYVLYVDDNFENLKH